VEREPDLTMAWLDLARFYQDEVKDFDQAEAAYRAALEHDPENPRLLHALGLLLTTRAKRHDEARELWLQATTIEPSFAEAWTDLALLEAVSNHDSRRVMAYYQRAIDLGSRDARPWIHQALILAQAGEDMDLALSYAREGRRLAPDQPLAQLVLASVLVAGRQWTEAEPVLRRFFSRVSRRFRDLHRDEVLWLLWQIGHQGFSARAADLLDAVPRAERWRAEAAALRALTRKTRSSLRRLPRELQRSAGDLHRVLSAATPPAIAES